MLVCLEYIWIDGYDKPNFRKDRRHWFVNHTRKILAQGKETTLSFLSSSFPKRIKMILKKSFHP